MYSYSVQTNSITKFYSQGFEEQLRVIRNPKRVICSNKRKRNEMSKKAMKRIRNSANNLLYLSKKRAIKIDGTVKCSSFRGAFITLKLPSKQMHPHSVITKQCLNQFLVQLRKSYGLKNYIWKAEIQSNGNIHYHLLIDQYVNYMAIRKYWNSAIQKLGYVTAYRNLRRNLTLEEYQYYRNLEGFKDSEKIYKAWEYGQKTDWKSPNSTDVKLVRNPEGMSAYISKYLSKPIGEEESTGIKADSQKELTGRLWFQSQSLSRLKNVVVSFNSKIDTCFKMLLKSKKCHVFSTDWITCVFFRESDFGDNFKEYLKKIFLTNAYRCSYPFPSEFHPVYYHQNRLLTN